MASNIVIQAWQHYRGHGLGPLLRGIRRDVFRFVPLRYRLAARRGLRRLRYGRGAVERPLRTYWIDPGRIRHNGPTLHHLKYVGKSLGGDWDRDPSPLTDDWMYRGLQQRFAEDRDWEDTLYYQRSRMKFEAEGTWLNYDDFSSFTAHRLPYLDRLYENIEENGYKTKSDIDDDERDTVRHRDAPRVSEITCNVGRDGTLLLNDGIHRLSIAHALDLEEIPVQIVARHNEWLQLRSRLARASDIVEKIREHELEPTHPDLMHIDDT